mmetsp:Transcript_133110/g.332287  ORF Transcript_133110/g.332287 Transcript_133110/m.332287 type:complete len:200 (+) Transcript_133110:557-1156(+)
MGPAFLRRLEHLPLKQHLANSCHWWSKTYLHLPSFPAWAAPRRYPPADCEEWSGSQSQNPRRLPHSRAFQVARARLLLPFPVPPLRAPLLGSAAHLPDDYRLPRPRLLSLAGRLAVPVQKLWWRIWAMFWEIDSYLWPRPHPEMPLKHQNPSSTSRSRWLHGLCCCAVASKGNCSSPPGSAREASRCHPGRMGSRAPWQ